MRRYVAAVVGAAIALTVLVLAGIGVASLIDDDGPSDRQRIKNLIEATGPDGGGAAKAARTWAVAHIRPGEEIRRRGCGVTTQVQTFHYRCEISYRNRAGRYRGYEIRLVQSVPGHIFTVVRVRPREAGPGAQ